MKAIALNDKGTLYTVVDDADCEWLNLHKWSYCNGYVGRVVGHGTVKMHRAIMQVPDGHEVDHRDRNPLNNTRDNLRIATRSQNARNQCRHSGGTSKFKGVCWDKNEGRYLMYCRIGKKRIHGSYKTEIEAARAYNELALATFGEFAVLNDLSNPDNPVPAPPPLPILQVEPRARDGRPRGIEHPDCLCTPEMVMQIVELRKNGVSGRDISRQFNIRDSVVYQICSGRSWAWLTGIKVLT